MTQKVAQQLVIV